MSSVRMSVHVDDVSQEAAGRFHDLAMPAVGPAEGFHVCQEMPPGYH